MFLFLLIFFLSAKTQLIVNEFSQGPSGFPGLSEYIELVVMQPATCTNSTVDLRGWVVDDHNGWFGIISLSRAVGHLRFANHANWANVPSGSIIVIYYHSFRNPKLPANDPTDSNGDGVYIVPYNSIYIETNDADPPNPGPAPTTYAGYPYTAGSPYFGNVLGLADAGDAIIILNPTDLTVPSFSILYGAGITSTTAMLPTVTMGMAVGAGRNGYLVDGQFSNASSWAVGTVPTAETPGLGNTPANQAWIQALRTIPAAVTPTFNPVSPICSGTALAALPTTSLNGITGTWSPALTNMSTTVYTFTPTPGQCAATFNLTITVSPLVAPTFDPVAPICAGAALAPLPTTSLENITGTWSPALNNTATTTYTFTPAAGQCATTTNLTITINAAVTPTFNPVGPICSGAALAALPTTSLNNITGSWSPALNNTATTTYTFTPAAGQCATMTNLTVTVNPAVTPAFNPVGPICPGAALAALPTTSLNNITGSWSPALNNTATTTYTFTPNAGQCGTTATLTVTVGSAITPTFDPVGPICPGVALAPLPTTSLNNITGNWTPAFNNTATTTYTFTPAAGQCATTSNLTVTVNAPVTPTFNPVGPICSGAALGALPTTSLNNITGSWSPALNNTATTTYTFTPNAGQCGTTATLSVTVGSAITPTFDPVAPICSGAALTPLPTTSLNSITGTWSPALNNTATTTYTFTPAAGQCATINNLIVTVSPAITPAFNPVGPLCINTTPPSLPLTSNNGINGTWNPGILNTSTAGTTTYTFTPAMGQCAGITQLSVIVQPSANLTITNPPVVCAPKTVDLTSAAITSASGPGLLYSYWMDAAATIALSNPAAITASGTYYIKATAAGACSVAQTEPVVVVIRQEAISMRYPTLTVLPDVPLPLYARNPGSNYSFSWLPAVGLNAYNVRTPVFNYNRSTEYIINIDAGGGCLIVDTLLIQVAAVPSPGCDLFVPKAWSPNGDGHNDKLFPLTVCITQLKYFRVFNRWGRLMFETNLLGNGWDGTFRGQPQVMDTYTWTLKAVGADGRDIHRAGNALLLR